MRIKSLFLFIGCSCLVLPVMAQTNGSSIDLNGYLSSMQSVIFEEAGQDWTTENQFHNRLNLYWYPAEKITGTIQLRNRLIYGDIIKQNPAYAKILERSSAWMDLSANLASGNSYILNTEIDRLWMQLSTGSLVTTIGRQRINWGQNLVWNPNDLFNVYSYFEVDYEERPGSDAIRLQLYPNFTSTAELAAKIDSGNNVTLAGLYRFNKWNYDIQILGGLLNSEDYVAGMGFSGNLGGAALRGELSYFRSLKEFEDTSGYVMSALGVDYAFKNAIMIQLEFLFSGLPSSDLNFLSLYSGPLSVKQLAFTRYSLFGALTYPINPLLQGSFASMYFPKLKGAFIGPSLTYNLTDNVDLSFFLQYFTYEQELAPASKARQNITFTYLRFRWDF